MDADITGPSIPKMFGVHGKLDSADTGLFPAQTERLGIRIVSLNLLLDRGRQARSMARPSSGRSSETVFGQTSPGETWTFMVIDLPPGTGDIPLSVMPIDTR